MQERLKSQSASTNGFLSGLGQPEIDAILAGATERVFHPKQVICRTGEEAKFLFLLQKGGVKFYRVTDGGHEAMLDSLVPGEIFGLGSLLTARANYMATAEALENCETLVWGRTSIQRLASHYPKLSENALRIALYYVALFAERLISLRTSTAEQRLAQILTGLGSRSGQPTPVGVEVSIKNEDLASLVDISRFTASRLLKKWERQGAVKKSRGKVLIRNPEKLLIK